MEGSAARLLKGHRANLRREKSRKERTRKNIKMVLMALIVALMYAGLGFYVGAFY